ncbi:MAG: prepilin-type N-terminal cleavage/methylation domain-containing protein [Patescibacteria group bacterium]|jgi:prepilin-type N-terminal cleavage/methylation domain-containing protein
MKHKNHKGFTLLEILLVVAAIGILAGIVILALNPNKQLGDTRNAQRRSDVTTVLNAVYQYSIDNNGTIPADIAITAKEICNTGISAADCTLAGLAYLGDLTLNEKYLTAIPKDPTTATTNSAKYTILKTANNRITVAAPSAEQSATISVTR